MKGISISFAYNPPQHIVPSIPYLRLRFSSDTSLDLTAQYTNRTSTENPFIFDSALILPPAKAGDLLLATGLGFTFYSHAGNSFTLSLLLQLEKSILPDIKAGIIYQPFSYINTNNGKDSYIRINGISSIRLSWEL